MFIVLYRWRIKPEFEQQFINAWSEITALIRKNFDSLGSRLHRGSDGLFYGYAQWKSAEQRANYVKVFPDFPARGKMREAIEETFPEVIIEMVSDYLIQPEKT